jgi:hypothetical protein
MLKYLRRMIYNTAWVDPRAMESFEGLALALLLVALAVFFHTIHILCGTEENTIS